MLPTPHSLALRSFGLAALGALLVSVPGARAAGPLAPLSAPSPAYTLPIHAVIVSDGVNTPPITTAEIQDWVDYANGVYDEAGVHFFFDENNPDMSNLTNTNLSGVVGDGDSTWANVLSDGNAEAAKHPGKVVVFFRYGPPGKPEPGGFSDDSYNFIAMPGFNVGSVCGHQNIMLFAHEAGHYFGLAHTFALDPFVYNTKPKVETLYTSKGKQASLFNGDGLSDTAPDPFLWDDQCDATILSDTISGDTFSLPRTNIMSYYDDVDGLSQQQIETVRQTIEQDLHDLFPSDPAIQPAAIVSPPGASSKTYDSPDLWIDSSFNGWGNYVSWQTVDAQGVPQGTGDPFWPGKLNYIHYRVRNLGSAAASNVKVQVSLVQPLIVSLACGGKQSGAEKVLATQTIDLLEPGATYQGKVPWIPTTHASGLIKVQLLDTPFELSTTNNKAQETLGTSYFPPGSLSLGNASTPQTFNLAVFNPCNLFIPIRVVPVGPPPDWEVTLEPMDFLLGPGEARSVKVRLIPPQDAAPGDIAGFNFSILAPSGDAAPLLGEFTLTGLVAEPMSLTCTSPEAPTVGTPTTVGGQAMPAQSGLPLWLEYFLPDGTLESHEVTTNGGGAFADTFAPAAQGPWTVQVFSEGDLEHQPARSRLCPFRVGPPLENVAVPAIGHQVSTEAIYYRGGGCGPKQVDIRATLQGPVIPSSMVTFFRLRDQDGGGTTTWNEGVAMGPATDGWFEMSLFSETIPGYLEFAHARLELQFVATDVAGTVLARSPVVSEVVVELCSR